MPERNEVTGEAVKALASKINLMSNGELRTFVQSDAGARAVKSVAASALTQAPARKKFLGLF